MFTAYVVAAVLAAANAAAAALDLARSEQVLGNMTKLGLPRSWLFPLGALKAAGALGLLVGIGVPPLGVAAAVGLVLFFVGAVIIHIRPAEALSYAYPGNVSAAGRGLAGATTRLVVSGSPVRAGGRDRNAGQGVCAASLLAALRVSVGAATTLGGLLVVSRSRVSPAVYGHADGHRAAGAAGPAAPADRSAARGCAGQDRVDRHPNQRIPRRVGSSPPGSADDGRRPGHRPLRRAGQGRQASDAVGA
jgi:hypothetical protein